MPDRDSAVSPPGTMSSVADSPPMLDFASQRAPSNTSSISQHGMSIPHPPGATVYTPTSAPGTELNPRSCVTCRRRKVRCDKHMPCANCRRAQIPCIFPAPERAPRRPRRKDPNMMKQQSSERELELMKRLRKLEGIVEELSGQIELETTRHQSASGDSPEAITTPHPDVFMSGSNSRGFERAESISGGSNASQASPMMGNGLPTGGSTAGGGGGGGSGGTGSGSPGRLMTGFNSSFGPLVKQSQSKEVNKKFGRLVLNDHGRSRYVSSAFWSKINDELDALRTETQKMDDDESDMSDTESSPGNDPGEAPAVDHHSFIFGYRSSDVDLRPLHPLPSQIPFLWQVFQENVDPMIKILHIPTMTKVVRGIRTNMDNLTPGTEALMFAIYYASVTSLDDQEVKVNFMADKETLVRKYRFALEQSLAKADFLTSSEMVTLQAFVFFLVLVRRHDDTRFAWTMTGLAIRICQSMGLHRDGTNFPSLSPFEVEMRRRLFWAVAILDLRAAEDQGTDLTLLDRAFDTRFPLNINDADINPNITELPQPREGTTDMTFSLIRYEICSVARRLHAVNSATAALCPKDAESSLADRERMIQEVYERMEKLYLKDCPAESNPIYWVAANIARVICAKMTVVIYQPVLFPSRGNDDLSRDLRDRLFNAATEIFEYNYMLTTDPRTKQWRWLFQTYTQWHAVAYVLMEVSRRPWSATVERAWAALNSVFTNPKSLELERMVDNTAVWLPFKKLYTKARKHREAEIQRLRDDPEAAIKLDIEDRSRAPAGTFTTLPGSIQGSVSRERWRKLVGEPPLPSTSAPQPRPPDMVSSSAFPASASASSAQQQAVASDNATQFLNTVFSQPMFEPTDLYPMAFSEDMANDMARAAVFGFGNTELQQQDTLGMYGSNNATSSIPNGALTARVLPQQQHQQQQQQQQRQQQPGVSDTPLVDAIKKDHPPPWLWNDSLSQIPQFQGVHVDDADVNMDENFDWQNFGENLRGFEMETGGVGGVWGGHGI